VRSLKRLARFAVLACVVAVPAAFAAGAGAKTEDTTLTLLQSTTYQVPLDAMIADFEAKNPTIHIKTTYQVFTTAEQTELTELQAGNAQDILFTVSGSGGGLNPAIQLGDAGRLADLSARKWVKGLPSDLRAAVSSGKKVYALPFADSPYAMLYNEDLYAQLNLKPPTTFAQFLAQCKVAKDNGKFMVALQNRRTFMFQILGDDVYGPVPKWNQLRAAGKVSFATSPQWQKAVGRWITMNNAGCFSPDAANPSGVIGPQQFAAGQALTLGSVTSSVPSLLAINPNLHIGFYPFPADTAAKTVVSLNAVFPLAVNAASPQKPAAMQFIDFLARPNENALYAKIINSISALQLKVHYVPSYLAPLNTWLKGKNKTRPDAFRTWPTSATNVTLDTELSALLTGQATTQQVLAAMDDSWGK
jgi:raffinose/stachyose/melibiose transport system substrate-binding protein